MRAVSTAKVLQKRLDDRGIVVADHPYDRGYWMCFAGLRIPTELEARAGWKDCHAELADDPQPKATE